MSPLVPNLLLLAVWAFSQRRALTWLGQGLLTSEGTLHLVLATGLAALLLKNADLGRWARAICHPARGPWTAWMLLLGGPALLWGAQLPFRSVHGMVAVLSAYGLAGVFAPVHAWRQARPLAVLAAAVLPLTGHLDVILGLPLRRFTAELVAPLLGGVASSTVLEVAGGHAFVDLPCAGVQSLWSAMVLLAFATWWWGRRLGLGWLGIWALTAGTLLFANAVRVFVLVGAHHHLGSPLLAEVLHTPIGVLGFLLALVPGFALLRLLPTAATDHGSQAMVRLPVWLVVVLLAVLAVPRPSAEVVPLAEPLLPTLAVRVAPTEVERSFIQGHGGSLAKGSIPFGTGKASVVVVASRSWVAQHVPEMCLAADGWELVGDRPVRIGGLTVRLADLRRGTQTATALWWFETGGRTTDDHTERMAAGLLDSAPWLMTSVLLPGSRRADDPALADLIASLRASHRDTLASLERP